MVRWTTHLYRGGCWGAIGGFLARGLGLNFRMMGVELVSSLALARANISQSVAGRRSQGPVERWARVAVRLQPAQCYSRWIQVAAAASQDGVQADQKGARVPTCSGLRKRCARAPSRCSCCRWRCTPLSCGGCRHHTSGSLLCIQPRDCLLKKELIMCFPCSFTSFVEVLNCFSEVNLEQVLGEAVAVALPELDVSFLIDACCSGGTCERHVSDGSCRTMSKHASQAIWHSPALQVPQMKPPFFVTCLYDFLYVLM